MEIGRLSPKGQITIPAAIRALIGLKPGDLVAYDVQNGAVTLRKLAPLDDEFHTAVSGTLTEWVSPEDEAAFLLFD
jgi:AbrB family looped-hinge helix DNA binding protein